MMVMMTEIKVSCADIFLRPRYVSPTKDCVLRKWTDLIRSRQGKTHLRHNKKHTRQ